MTNLIEKVILQTLLSQDGNNGIPLPAEKAALNPDELQRHITAQQQQNENLIKWERLQDVKSLIDKKDKTTDEFRKILSYVSITDDTEITPIKYTLQDVNGVGFLPLGDISAVKGRAKHGKTFFTSMIVASVLGCDTFGLRTKEIDSNVLLVDTEQHKSNVCNVRSRILDLTNGKGKDNLHVLALREFAPSERLEILKIAVKEITPKFVIVDGVADLISNSNDIEQSQRIISDLSQIACVFDCHILNVLHLTRTSDNGGMRGHLGTELLNKCSDCIEVKKDVNIFTATHTDSRNKNIEPIVFAIGENGIPYLATELLQQQKEEKQQAERAEQREIWLQYFGDDDYLKHGELITRLCSFTNCTESGAKTKIRRATDKGLIQKNIDQNYYVVR